MNIFFGKMGITNLKYKPAYNPYTEPSMEIFSYRTCSFLLFLVLQIY